MFPSWTPLIALLLLITDGVSSAKSSIYRKEGDEVVLSPGPVAGPITSIKWKHQEKVASRWTRRNIVYYQDFRGRYKLNTTTGELIITDLSKEDSGSYTVEINYRVHRTTEILVISAVPTPTITTQCSAEKTYCVLTCEGNTTGAEPVSYEWTSGDSRLGSDKEINITKEEKEKWFRCMLVNPVSSQTSEQVPNPFNRGYHYAILCSFILLILLICGLFIISCKCIKGPVGDKRPLCPDDPKCYRKNIKHWKDFRHTTERVIVIPVKFGVQQKNVKITKATLEAFFTAVKGRFKIPAKQHLRVFDSLETELDDDDVFERIIERFPTLALTIKYDPALAPPTETSAPNGDESREMEEKKRLIPQHDPPPSDVIIKVEASQLQEGVQEEPATSSSENKEEAGTNTSAQEPASSSSENKEEERRDEEEAETNTSAQEPATSSSENKEEEKTKHKEAAASNSQQGPDGKKGETKKFDQSAEDKRPLCEYDPKCYRTNPKHWEDLRHTTERVIMIPVKFGDQQKYVKITKATLEAFFTAVKGRFKIPAEQHLGVFDSLETELDDDDDVFERTIENPSTLVLTIKYDPE